jgi:hypothetical protein
VCSNAPGLVGMIAPEQPEKLNSSDKNTARILGKSREPRRRRVLEQLSFYPPASWNAH